jgi:hypothetical protein
MLDVLPTRCTQCEASYTQCGRHDNTMTCGHSFCEQCTARMARCPVCHQLVQFETQVSFLAMVCAGCGFHIMDHGNTRINQVRILACGHRQFCSHKSVPFNCGLCNNRQVQTPVVDVSATAIVCGVSVSDVHATTQGCRPSRAGALCRLLRRCMRRARRADRTPIVGYV